MKDADFNHTDVWINSPGLEIFKAIRIEHESSFGHIFLANAKFRDAYGGLAGLKKAGFAIHAKWKHGCVVGLPLNFEPNTIEAAWRLFNSLERLGVFRRSKYKSALLKPDFMKLSQAGDYLATYEKKFGRVFGCTYTDGIRPIDTVTLFGPDAATPAKPEKKPSKASPAKTESKPAKTAKPSKPVPAVPRMSELDEIFENFSNAFLGKLKGAKSIAFTAQLARDQLNYSLDSLKLVDEYLTYLHKHKKKISDSEWNSIVLYGGAYVGEVIRRATGGHFRWIDYDEYMPQYPKLKAMIPERNTATCAFLVDSEGSMRMPLNKIARYIEDGTENSVHFFAQCDIQQANSGKTKKKSKT